MDAAGEPPTGAAAAAAAAAVVAVVVRHEQAAAAAVEVHAGLDDTGVGPPWHPLQARQYSHHLEPMREEWTTRTTRWMWSTRQSVEWASCWIHGCWHHGGGERRVVVDSSSWSWRTL